MACFLNNQVMIVVKNTNPETITYGGVNDTLCALDTQLVYEWIDENQSHARS